MRDYNETLLKLKDLTPGATINGTGVDMSRALDVENARSHTVAVKLLLHSSMVQGSALITVTDAFYTSGDSIIQLENGATVESLNLRENMSVYGNGIPQCSVLSFPTTTSIEFADVATDSSDGNGVTFELPGWTPSSDTVTITVYAVLPQLTPKELPPYGQVIEELVQLDQVTMTLADLASKGYGRSEGLCGYSAVKVRIESSSTAWPMFGQLVVWGLVNREPC